MLISRPLRLAGGAALLILVVSLIYGQSWKFEFLSWDDPMYVTGNRNVSTGLTPENLLWAFQTRHFGLWNPLTWISLMADATFWGKNPGGFHITNLLLHSVAATMLFLFLEAATGAFWRSLTVALMFAAHPLGTESVAWISGRKDVLMAGFYFATLYCHTRRSQSQRTLWTVLAYVCAICAGLSKPMAVSLPVALVIADIWPLKRFDFGQRFWHSLWFSMREKWPLFLCAAILASIHFVAPANSGLHAMTPEQTLTLPQRLQVAGATYGIFLWKMIWPEALSFFQPLYLPYSPWQYLASPILLLIFGLFAWYSRARAPFLLAGALWYSLTLFPVSGIFQISALAYAYADRYAYLPLVGIYCCLAWAFPDTVCKQLGRTALMLAGILLLTIVAKVSHWQASHWRDSIALHQRALDLDANNRMARLGLGFALMQKHQVAAAEKHFEQVLAGSPPDMQGAQAKFALGNIAGMRGDMDAAVKDWKEALAMNNQYVYPSLQLGRYALQQGRFDEAIRHFEEADRREPNDVEILNNLGVAHVRKGDLEGALVAYRRAVASDGGNRTARLNLARTLEKLGLQQESADQYNALGELKLRSDHPR